MYYSNSLFSIYDILDILDFAELGKDVADLTTEYLEAAFLAYGQPFFVFSNRQKIKRPVYFTGRKSYNYYLLVAFSVRQGGE